MLKSLLASAAALTTLSLAHAADLPMTKAEPVEYVKICSEFGDGFYYIPGSDTCLSINGYVRADYWWFEPDSRADDGLEFRGRGRVNFDARTATEWGTLRSFLSLQYTYNGATSGVTADKAFIQFGGWTAGYATSFYDFYDAEAGNTIYGTYYSSGKTTHLLAYTAVFGDGLAATLSVEDNYIRREGMLTPIDADVATPSVPNPYAMYGGQRAPDVVASLRWTQGWGEAQIMAAVHQNRDDLSNSLLSGLLDNDSKWGWAVGAGALFNLPSGFFFALEGNYARGAASYAGLADGKPGNDVNDALNAYMNGLGGKFQGTPVDLSPELNLSRVWSITADLGYNFTPALVGHIVASYANYDAPSNHTFPAVFSNSGFPGDVDFNTLAITTNLTYTIVNGLTIAGELSYEERDYSKLRITLGSGFPLVNDDYDVFAGGVRLRRSF